MVEYWNDGLAPFGHIFDAFGVKGKKREGLKFSLDYDTVNMMKKEIFKKDLARIVSISKEFGAEKVFLFGSCLEKVESARDIDIAVKGVKPEKFFEMYGKILGAIASEIDLIPLEDVREHFANRILEKGRLLYG